jgi:hypothetical protein
MTRWLRKRPLPARIMIYAAAATLAFALAAGVGAIGALTLGGDLSLLEREEPPPADEDNADRAQDEDGTAGREQAAAEQKEVASRREEAAAEREKAAAERERIASRQEKARYVGAVGDIQTIAVEAFLKSHDKLLRYDALTAVDVKELQANEATLKEVNEQTGDLAPPREYQAQYEVFSAAIDELHEATRLAYGMAADPVAAAELGFDEYDGHVDEASVRLRRSNELLNRDYETIENVREVSPQF